MEETTVIPKSEWCETELGGGTFQAEAKASLTFFRLAKTLLRSVITKKVSIHEAEAGRS